MVEFEKVVETGKLVAEIAVENDNFAAEVENVVENLESTAKIAAELTKVAENVEHVPVTKALGAKTYVTAEKKFVLTEFEAEGEFTKVQSRKKYSHPAATTYGAKHIIPTPVTTISKLKLGQHHKDAKRQGWAHNKSNDKSKGITLPLSQ